MDIQQDHPTSSHPSPISDRKRLSGGRIARCVLLCAVAIFAAIAAAPFLASTDVFRDYLLNTAVEDSSLKVTSESGSFSWRGATRVDGLTVSSPDGQLQVESERVRFDRPWWRLWIAPRSLGQVEIVSPNADIDLDWRSFEGYSAGQLPQFSAAIDDAQLLVQLEMREQPVIDVRDVDVDVRVEQERGIPQLSLDDTLVLDHRRLDTRQCGELLQLMDPMLADVVQVEGRFSLAVASLKIPLNVDAEQQRRQMRMSGRLRLHDVTTSAKTPLLRGIIRVAAAMHDRPPSEIVRVANESTVEVDVREGRVHHKGLEFGLPDIDPELQIRSHGFVGLDESLDLHVTIPKLFLGEQEADAETAKQAVRLRITGSIREPQIVRLDKAEELSADERTANMHYGEPIAAAYETLPRQTAMSGSTASRAISHRSTPIR